ncbi:UBA domain-containing protein [Citrus sinensis]|uniref:UBA domain-containing protein n=1 Tax=Citrus sinensis TaxID=2711 RepID=A0ACB8MGP5_CITSI|nr:UBA domain-containing protein [Citrus sinensis]
MLRLQGFSEATRSLNHAVIKTSFGCQPFNDAILLPPIFNAVRSRYEYESLVASFNFNATICNGSLEDAINWIVDHENDAEDDEMPLIAVNIEIESPQPDHMMEEVEKKAQEKRDQAYQREEEEKKPERNREKVLDVAYLGATSVTAKNTCSFSAARKAEKEEVKRARQKIRQKIEADKVERRRQLGFPSEKPVTLNPSKPIVQDKMTSLPVMTITKAEKMRECLRSLRRNHKEDDARVKRAFQTLLIYVGNIVKNPNEEKYRKIRLGNPLFQDRVGSMKGGIEFLELCGFEKTEGGDFLHLPSEKLDMEGLNAAGSLLRSAMTNPFFGLLGG